MSSVPTPVEVFCSYAYEDEGWLRKLETHLSLLKRQGVLSLWRPRLITAGTDWARAIDTQLTSASIILLLISPSFFASNYCYGVEMQTALQRHQADKARVIPILVRPVDWKAAPFAHLSILPTNGKPITEWHNRDAAFADIAAGLRRVIEELSQVTLTASTSATWWNVPYPRNLFFTGREDLLATLEQALHAGQPTALSQPQAMSGLGGVGKTQLAIEYAYRHMQNYEAIFWVLAANHETLHSGFVALADLLQLPERNGSDQHKTVAAVKRWFQYHSLWLLILDNADDLSLLPDFLPPVRPGHLLLTTRSQALGGLANRIEVNTLDQSSGMELLLRRAGWLAPDAPLMQAKEVDLLNAQRIWQVLGGLPLALDQAGAYIEETRCNLLDYLHLFRTHRTALLQKRGGVLRDHPDSVHTTFTLSIRAMTQCHPAVMDMLRVCALLHPDAIPEEVFRQGANLLGTTLEATCTDLLNWNTLLATVCSYSLLKRHSAEQMLTMHRLVQAVIQETMSKPEHEYWTHCVIRALDSVFPKSEHRTWRMCERLVPHVLRCEVRTQSWENVPLELASLLQKTADYLYDRAQYGEAEPLYQRALHIREQALGPTHPEVARLLHGLAELYRKQGKYEQAEPLFHQALYIQELTPGPDHSDVATSLNNLARLFYRKGKYEQAEPLYQRVLQIREHAFGAEHSEVAHVLHGLAKLSREQGKYEQAEFLFHRALHIWEQTPGSEHPDLAHSLNGLATIYFKQGKYEQAEFLFQKALRIWEQISESEHPDLAHPLNGLATVYFKQGKYEQAEFLFQRALEIREQALDPLHPETAETLHDFATFWEAQGKRQEATSLYQRALSIREQVFGQEHPKTAATRTRYDALLRAIAQHNDGAQAESKPPPTEEG